MFYKNMVWVVDGTRLSRDYPRFLKGSKHFRTVNVKGQYLVEYPGEVFPANWLTSSVPVIFDFKGMEAIDNPSDERHNLYCLLHKRVGGYAILFKFSRKAFIAAIINGNWSLRVQKFIEVNIPIRYEQQQQELDQAIAHYSALIKRTSSPWVLGRGNRKRGRRF
ncbi:MAG: hypothetical protein IPP15_06545 [Saprospiraceae bacterium]|uniref:Uncharacterized protein n=1 Tax=Candidatus Opimibacter skivensis TaxID=2982028 RepID=A0A9D7XPI9_9BACT|nr:hypothetical protein [Candidatus Opimibacter skivensis]